MLKRFLITSLVSLFLLPIGITSQDKKDKDVKQTPVEIKANVLVSDEKNQIVGDVKMEDVKIYEDGVEQKLLKLTKTESVNVGILVDNSGSLRTQFETILATASAIAKNLREEDKAFTIRFVSRSSIEITQNWTSDKNLLVKSINNMYTQGGQSAVVDAIKVSADHLIKNKSESKRNVLVLISDCEDRDSYYTTEQVLKHLRENEIEVYVLGFTGELENFAGATTRSVRSKAETFGKLLADETGGEAYFPKWSRKNKDELVAAAKETVLGLRSQYIAEYVSTNSDRKIINERKINIEVADSANGEKRLAVVRSFIKK